MAQNLLLPDFVGGALRYAQAGDQLRRNEQLAGLSSQAYSAETPEAQKSLLSQMAAVNPAAAQQQKAAFQSDEDRRFSRLSNAARYLERARQSGNPAQLQGAWNAVRPMLQREVPQANYPEQWDDATMAPVLYEALARTGGVGGQVQSTKIGEDGFYWTVDRAGNWTNSGIKADPRTQLRDQPGLPPGIVDLRAGTISGITEAGAAPQGPVEVGQGAGALRMDIEGIPPEAQQRMAQTVSMMQQAGYPQQEIDAFIGAQMSQNPPQPQGGGLAAPRPAISPAEAERLRLAEQANARANEASRRADEAAARAAEAANRGTIPAGYERQPDGSLVRMRGAPEPTAGAAKVSDSQRNAAGFYDRMVASNAEMQRLEQAGYDPTSRRDYYTAGNEILNPLATNEGQQYRQAQNNWVRANLRKESGAAIGDAEMENERRTYFPIPGDSDAVIEQKRRARQVTENAMKQSAGAARQAGEQPTTQGWGIQRVD